MRNLWACSGPGDGVQDGRKGQNGATGEIPHCRGG